MTPGMRFKTHEVSIGNVPLGADNPIRIQTMVNTNTLNIEATIRQIKIIEAQGTDYIRLAVQSLKEAAALREIHTRLRASGSSTPLIADVHFNPDIAYACAEIVEKVRINPGNFAEEPSLTNEEALKKVREKFIPFLDLCKKNKVAIRVGSNHGSLSKRILETYGDTPEGMVESVMEYLRICQAESFLNVVVSLKSSNTRVMVQSYRLMVKRMMEEGMSFPLHLGVTEAGEGEDGRIKSAVGISALLVEGIGDTIRVSLSEPPENELPVARQLVTLCRERYKATHFGINKSDLSPMFKKPLVIASSGKGIQPDLIWKNETRELIFNKTSEAFSPIPSENSIKYHRNITDSDSVYALEIHSEHIPLLKKEDSDKILITVDLDNKSAADSITALRSKGFTIVGKKCYNLPNSDLALEASCDFGMLLIDKAIDGLWIENTNSPNSDITALSFGILQAAGARITKTEFISCPTCGRTLFDLSEINRQIKEKLSHLKNLKIAVMGCVVNGPGEMADADYGCIISGKDRFALYKGKERIKNNIPRDKIFDELTALIKESGDWVD